MMNLNLFGVGAAGNKAAIAALEAGILSNDCVKLINTTTKDIPEKYKKTADMVVQFSSMLGGCGKEPKKGASAIAEAISTNKIDFGSMVTDDCNQVVLVTSTEGGTGCGATPIIAKYFEAMNLPVHVFAFIGFQDESRGLKNTLMFFKNLSDNVILHTIMNDKFMDYTDNYTKAEEAANNEFVRQLEIIKGSKMIPSSQNIDDTDLYKITTTSGYMDIKHVSMEEVKNQETFEKAIKNAFENGTCLDYDNKCKRLAIIVDASERVQDAIDSRLNIIRRYTGEPYEIFRHIQDTGDDEYMDIIVSGMNFPEKGIKDINKKSTNLKQNLNKEIKGFDAIFDGIDMDDDDDFDVDFRQREKVKPVDFNPNAVKVTAKVVDKSTDSEY